MFMQYKLDQDSFSRTVAGVFRKSNQERRSGYGKYITGKKEIRKNPSQGTKALPWKRSFPLSQRWAQYSEKNRKSLPGSTHFAKYRKKLKKDAKKCWQKAGDVVLYLSAKGRRKEWLLKAAEAKRKNQYGYVEKRTTSSKRSKSFWKKCLTKNHFCGKIIKSSAARLRRTGPWKLNNIEKLVTEPIFVLEKHVKQFQTK